MLTLIADPDGAVHGLVARIDGQERNVRARRGVILCAGGFAMNHGMLAHHALRLLGRGIYLITSHEDYERLAFLNAPVAGTGETIEELAADLGLDPAMLRHTVDYYDAHAARREDPPLHKSPDWLKPLEPPPTPRSTAPPLRANVAETPRPAEFGVEGDRGIYDGDRDGSARHGSGGEGDTAAIHRRVQAEGAAGSFAGKGSGGDRGAAPARGVVPLASDELESRAMSETEGSRSSSAIWRGRASGSSGPRP